MKVCIVGRPNVGKSALFNRLIKKRVSIVEEIPGITRDRITCNIEWNRKSFTLIDTGGIDINGMQNKDNKILNAIQKQIVSAIEEADLLLFVVDGKVGLTPIDDRIARRLY
jgi:GTP-binding protein